MKQLLLVVIVVATVLYIISKISGVNEHTESQFDGESAYYNSKIFVKNILKSPTTAKFEDDCKSCAEKQTDGTWIVKSYVDAQNSFGATIRENYECHLSYSQNDDSVRCLSVKIIP